MNIFANNITVGDKVTLKKPHPCGGTEFTIERTGADFKLRCTKCGFVLLLSSEKLKKSILQRK